MWAPPGDRRCRASLRTPRFSGPLWPLGLGVVMFSLVLAGEQAYRSLAAKPTLPERIVAQLAQWNVAVAGLSSPTPQEEIDRQRERLFSRRPEERVRAAYWLAERGIRSAGPDIAASMKDAGTLRPCQLAHTLGRLGDPAYTDDLALATTWGSGDLRACAMGALSDIASTDSMPVLLELMEDPGARFGALRALAQIADPQALPALRTALATGSDNERRLAAVAIRRTEIASQPDPAPDLLALLESAGRIDTWALRRLALLGDPRSVEPLAEMLAFRGGAAADRVALAAALLAHGEAGIAALHEIADSSARRGAGEEVASAALGLIGAGAAAADSRLSLR